MAEARLSKNYWSQHPPVLLDDLLDHLKLRTSRVARDEGNQPSNLLGLVKLVIPHEPMLYEILGITTSSKVSSGDL